MVTDIVLGGTELIAIGPAKELALKAFGIDIKEDSIFLPGVLSRRCRLFQSL